VQGNTGLFIFLENFTPLCLTKLGKEGFNLLRVRLTNFAKKKKNAMAYFNWVDAKKL